MTESGDRNSKIAEGLSVAIDLIRRRREALMRLPDDAGTARFSFHAALYGLVPHALILFFGAPADILERLNILSLSLHVLTYVMYWTAFPITLYYFCVWQNKRSRFFRTLSALNWVQFSQMLILCIPFILNAAGFLPDFLLHMLSGFFLMYFLYIEAIILHHGLGIRRTQVGLLLLADIFIVLQINQAAAILQKQALPL